MTGSVWPSVAQCRASEWGLPAWQGGKVWEKAGVNVSVVYGSMPAEAYRAATTQRNGSGQVPSQLPNRMHSCFRLGMSSHPAWYMFWGLHPLGQQGPAKSRCKGAAKVN